MAKNMVSDAVILPLQKTLKTFCVKTGYTEDSVFEGLLDYMIGFLNPSLTPEPNPAWKFKPEDNETFHDMMMQVIRITQEQIPKKGWYDPFGDLYMALHSNGGGKEQYFTPPSVATATAQLTVGGVEPSGTMTPMGRRICISDPAGGSGRLALAGYCKMIECMQKQWGHDARWTEAHRPYISVEDLDFNCVKMAALNICLHSAYGEAVCHDTLCEPDKVRLGFIVGEADWPFPTGIPSVRKETNPLRFVCTRQWLQQQEIKKMKEQSQESGVSDFTPETPLSDPVQPKEKKQAVQLTLW